MLTKWFKAGLFTCVAIALAWSGAALAAEAGRAEVEALAKKYWSAEVAQDYGTAWEVLGPVQQAADPREDYVKLRTEKGPIRVLKAEVDDVDVDGDLAWTHVKYDWVVANF